MLLNVDDFGKALNWSNGWAEPVGAVKELRYLKLIKSMFEIWLHVQDTRSQCRLLYHNRIIISALKMPIFEHSNAAHCAQLPVGHHTYAVRPTFPFDLEPYLNADALNSL